MGAGDDINRTDQHNHATRVRKEKPERRQYHAGINFSLMVSMSSALLHITNTVKNTIDDADYFVD
jgi:hypothetical protein